jgi:predicted nucleic acid-binding protein
MLVIDSSVVLATVFPDEASDYAEKVLKQLEEGKITGCVPVIFHLEITNVLSMAKRRMRLTESEMIEGLEAIGMLPLHVDPGASHAATMEQIYLLMQKHQLTAYDASYLELALRRDLPLATLDKSLGAASCEENLTYCL